MSNTESEFISVLTAFDAMRLLLRLYWEKGGQRGDDLASLLGSLDRDTKRNGPPLDVALWSDWLVALLSIEPNLECVRGASQELEAEHRYFAEVLDAESQDQPNRRLTEFQSYLATRTWHRAGNCQIDIRVALRAVRSFLESNLQLRGDGSPIIKQIISELSNDGAIESSSVWNDWVAMIHIAPTAE